MIAFYSTKWCADCLRAKRVLEGKGVAFDEIDIEKDPAAGELVRQISGGLNSVPTIVFSDGTTLIEPSARELTGKLEALGL